MVERKEYLKELSSWKDDSVTKVITGMRRCGKSTLLLQYQNWLRENGVKKEQILTINFEEIETEPLRDYHMLYQYIKENLCEREMTYVFLDEIQNVSFFEKVVDDLSIKPNVDIYITGSNSYMLSGDLATLLSGRYVEISMLPFSFKEFCEASGFLPVLGEMTLGRSTLGADSKAKLLESAFAEYLRYGGLPYLAGMDNKEEKAEAYLEGIYNTVIVKDIEERQRRKESDSRQRKVNDITLLNSIAKYLAGSIGSTISIKNIADYLTSNGRGVSTNTIADYTSALAEAFVFYPVERFDITGKQVLSTNRKWYIADLGLRNYILPRRDYDLGFSIENVVYLELLRRGYQVNVGKQGDKEIDFIAKKQGVYTYFQVTADMRDKSTFEREIAPLKRVKDNYKKVILTLDQITVGNYEGIEVIYLLDWLMR